MYEPKPAPFLSQDPKAAIGAVNQLSGYVAGELQSVAQASRDSVDVIQLNVLNVAPKKLRDGMLIEADGVNFNPGAGAGCYMRRAGAWVKLG